MPAYATEAITAIVMMPMRIVYSSMVTPSSLRKRRVADIAQDALGVHLKPLNAADVGLLVPTDSLNFDAIAAPAGLARLAW